MNGERQRIHESVAQMSGQSALPRRNGELVFAEPWQPRVFGLAVVLRDSGLYDWDDFRQRLMAEIAAAGEDDGTGYYDRWLSAFQLLLIERGIVTHSELAAREAALSDDDEHHHDHDRRSARHTGLRSPR